MGQRRELALAELFSLRAEIERELFKHEQGLQTEFTTLESIKAAIWANKKSMEEK